MELAVIDYGFNLDLSLLHEVLPRLVEIFDCVDLGLITGELRFNTGLLTKKRLKNNSGFVNWFETLDKKIHKKDTSVIGFTVFPYSPKEQELYDFPLTLFRKSIMVTGYNSHDLNGQLIAVDAPLLATYERVLKVSIHELHELFTKEHKWHNGLGEPCSNNGDQSALEIEDPVEAALYFIDSLSPTLCDYCKKLIN